MALVIGTNCGFVTTAPTADPDDGLVSVDNSAVSLKDTSPSGNNIVTEIGWWCDNATEEANFEVGIYDHNGGDDEPEAVVGSLNQTNAKGTGSGWKVVTGLNISISASTVHWIAVQLDNTSTATLTNTGGSGRRAVLTSVSTLPSPWGTSFAFGSNLTATYAKTEPVVSATDNMTIIGENVY